MTNVLLISLFAAASAAYHLPPGLLNAICWVESSNNPHAVNAGDRNAPSVGLCQVQLPTARFTGYRGPASNLLNPRINLAVAAAYLHYQLKRYHGDYVATIAAYNAGTYRINRETSLPQNKQYVLKVLRAWKRIQKDEP